MYLNRKTGILTYVPRPCETPANSTVIAPVAPRARILISNGAAFGPTGALVGNLTFRNLTFANTGSYSRMTGYLGHFNNDQYDPYGTISGIVATNLTMDRCVFRDLGESAIMFGSGSSTNTVTNSMFFDHWDSDADPGFHKGGQAPVRH